MGLMPLAKLKNMLRVWSQEGLDRVRQMVQWGMTPAAALAVLSGEQQGQQPVADM